MKKFLPKISINPQGFTLLRSIKVNRSGFTLVELLVVIAIIAILAVIGAAVFSGMQGRARDAARRSDVVTFANAFDAAKVASSATYPALAGTMFAAGALPKDPISTRNYCISWSLTSANTFLGDPTGWPTSCTAGTATANSSAWGTPSIVSPTTPPNATTAYGVRVCATLEDGTTVVCSSTQQ